jgi:hypothetical protein
MSFDWESPVIASTFKEKLNRQEVKALVKRIHELWEAAWEQMARSQEQYIEQVNKHRHLVDFGVRDKV